MQIYHKDYNNNIQVYFVTVKTHAKALEAGQSSQGTSGPITLVILSLYIDILVIKSQSTQSSHKPCKLNKNDTHSEILSNHNVQQAFREFLVLPALISNLNVHKSVQLHFPMLNTNIGIFV